MDDHDLRELFQLLREQNHLLMCIREELQDIREAAQTEAVEDSEDPFQTLNGPSSGITPGAEW